MKILIRICLIFILLAGLNSVVNGQDDKEIDVIVHAELNCWKYHRQKLKHIYKNSMLWCAPLGTIIDHREILQITRNQADEMCKIHGEKYVLKKFVKDEAIYTCVVGEKM